MKATGWIDLLTGITAHQRKDGEYLVFVEGDFWHGWRLPAWERKLSPFWRDKLRTNQERDQRNFRRLRALDWKVIRLWQHQVQSDIRACAARITKALARR